MHSVPSVFGPAGLEAAGVADRLSPGPGTAIT